MQSKKKLKQIIEKVTEESFENGKLREKNVKRFVEIFKKLSRSEALICLTAYLKGLKRELAKSTLEIEVATPISKRLVRKISKAVVKKNRS